MSTIHVVQQGEHISGIAARHGIANFRATWDHPANAAPAATRGPHVVFPRDETVIPERRRRVEFSQTTLLHVF